MTRYGAQFGPDFTFLGVDRCDLDDPGSYADADVVILGAPFDGGTSHRPGTRFGPQAIRMTDYLAHDGEGKPLKARTIIGLLLMGVGIAAAVAGAVMGDSSTSTRASLVGVGAVGVIVAAIVIRTTGWLQADALAGLLIAALIVPRAVGLLREVVVVLTESAPVGVHVAAIREHRLVDTDEDL